MNKLILLLQIILFSISFPRDYPVRFKHLTTEDGLSQSNVRCILQDRFGFIWAGTQDGLNRYDGYGFTIFKNNPNDSNSIASNLISCILEDRDGFIWIGTLGGLSRYDPLTDMFRNFKYEPGNNSLQSSSVIALHEDKEGNIWIGTYLGGLSRLSKNDNLVITYLHNSNDLNSLSNNSVTSIYEDDENNFWLTTWGGGLNKFDRQNNIFTSFSKRNSRIHTDTLTSVLGDEKGNLLIGSLAGLIVFSPTSMNFITYTYHQKKRNSLSDNYVVNLLKDGDNFWIATANGLDFFDTNKKEFYSYKKSASNPESLNDNIITSLYKDRHGILWIGTDSGGLNKLNLKSRNFKNISGNTFSRSLSNNVVRSIYKDQYGYLWIGTDYGLNKISPDGRLEKHFPSALKNSLSHYKIYFITEDHNGELWVGTYNGLNKYDRTQNNFISLSEKKSIIGLPQNWQVRYIYCDDQAMWLGTFSGGLINYDLKTDELKDYIFNADDILTISNNIIFYITKDHKEKLWICTSSGLNSFDPATEKFTRYFHSSQQYELPVFEAFYAAYEDEKKQLWLGTLGYGLIKFNPEDLSYRLYNEKNGLANNTIYGILPDQKGNLWLSTNRGITKFNPVDEQFINFDKTDGIMSEEFNTGAFFKDKEGILYFGGINGITYFHPDSISWNDIPPPVVVSNFKIYENQVFGNKIFIDGEEIVLGPNENYFSFEFSSLDFSDPSKNVFAYKLDGYDSEWIYSGKRRYAAYTHLDPGKYIFKVKASNNNGVWNEKGIALSIIIEPPYWQTWWFRILSGFIILSLVITGYIKRINALKKEQAAQEKFSRHLLESQEYERKRIAGELHDGIGQNLLIIKNRAKMGLNRPEKNELLNQMELISGIATESIDDVRNIAYNLHPYHMEEVGLTSTINSIINKFCELSSVKFTSFIENIDNIFPTDIEINIFRIIQESINNIIKHSDASEAVVSISKEDTDIKIVVSDNGKGFNQKEISSGLGLKGMSERVKFCSGSLNIESIIGKGTTIKIELKQPDRNIAN